MDYINDSLYRAAYLFKNILENAASGCPMGISHVSDTFEIPKISEHPVHGGRGILTFQGKKKLAFWALKLLGRFEGRIVCQQEGCMVLESEKDRTIFLYNAVPIPENFISGHQGNDIWDIQSSVLVDENRKPLVINEDTFQRLRSRRQTICVHLQLEVDENSTYSITSLSLTQEQQNFVEDAYLGKIDDTSIDWPDYWDFALTPKLNQCWQTADNGKIRLEYRLKAGEVFRIRIEKIK